MFSYDICSQLYYWSRETVSTATYSVYYRCVFLDWIGINGCFPFALPSLALATLNPVDNISLLKLDLYNYKCTILNECIRKYLGLK